MADISYTPTTWADGSEGGTPIDAAKLNNIESGIVDAVAAIGPNDTTADGTLKAQIDAIGESVNQLETWQDASNGVYCTKIGKLVIMKLYSSSSVQLVGGSNQITTIPSGWRPATDLPVGFCEVGGNAAQLLVYTDGLVAIWSNITANTYLRGFIAYFTS